MQILASLKQQKSVSWKGREAAAMEEKPIFAVLDFFFFSFLFFRTNWDGITVSCHSFDFCKANQRSKAVGDFSGQIWGCRSCLPCAGLPCTGPGPLTLYTGWTLGRELTQRCLTFWARPRVVIHCVLKRRRETRRRAGRPRGCALLSLSASETQGVGRLGPAEGLSLPGKARARKIPSANKAKL